MAPFTVLGGHFRNAQNSASNAWVANCPTVKSFDTTLYLDQAPAGAFTVYRKYFSSQDISQPGYNAANAVLQSLGGRRPTYVEGFNEVYTTHDMNLLAEYVRWTQEFTSTIHAAGLLVAGFSFNTGWPDASEWAYLRSVNFGGVDAVAMHEYWAKSGFTSGNALRHRTLWAMGDPPIVITECGRDCVDGVSCTGSNCGNQCGWNGNLQGPISAQQYANELLAYDQLIRQDNYVLLANVFTHGGAPDFASFEIDPLASIYWPAGTCGGSGQACCSGGQCGNGLTCNNGTCQPNQPPPGCGGGCPPGTPHCNAANVCVCFSDSECVAAFGQGNCCDGQFQCTSCNNIVTSVDWGTIGAFALLGIVGVGAIAVIKHAEGR